MSAIDAPDLRPSTLDLAFVWFLRVIAAYSFLFGVLYWIRLSGFYSGPLWRFDLMPLHWQYAATTLAALFPFAAIGLWMGASWGPVIWFICACIEGVMYAGFPELFGSRLLIVAAHGLTALLYVAFRLALYREKRSHG